MSEGDGMTILVVEDYEDTRFMMRKLLEISGYRVIEATNGLDAVEVAARERPDLILMDLSLPIFDGFTAARRIREHAAMRGVPIIAVTAHEGEATRSEALQAGCDEYITKPVNFESLERTIARLLEPE